MYSEILQKGIDEVVLNYLIKMKESASRDYIIAGIYSRAGDEQKRLWSTLGWLIVVIQSCLKRL